MQIFHLSLLHLYVLLWCAQQCSAEWLSSSEYSALVAVYGKTVPMLNTSALGSVQDNRRIECPIQGVVSCSNGFVSGLNWHNLSLQIIPSQLGQLTSLTQLDLSENTLENIPSQIGLLTLLKRLYLDKNNLQNLPAQIGQLTSLRYLYLAYNALQSLPPHIGQLTSLTGLYVNNNNLRSLPSYVGYLTSLDYLHLYDNNLQNVPSAIGSLTSLDILDLHSNNLQSVPSQFGQLTTLVELYLYNNQLKVLPSELEKLTSLRVLEINHNQLRGVSFLLARVPQTCRYQGVYENVLGTTYSETNCFENCPTGCCASDLRWPNCATVAPTPPPSPAPPSPTPPLSMSPPSLTPMIYIYLEDDDEQTPSSASSQAGVIVGIIVLLCAFPLLFYVVYSVYRKKKQNNNNNNKSKRIDAEIGSEREAPHYVASFRSKAEEKNDDSHYEAVPSNSNNKKPQKRIQQKSSRSNSNTPSNKNNNNNNNKNSEIASFRDAAVGKAPKPKPIGETNSNSNQTLESKSIMVDRKNAKEQEEPHYVASFRSKAEEKNDDSHYEAIPSNNSNDDQKRNEHNKHKSSQSNSTAQSINNKSNNKNKSKSQLRAPSNDEIVSFRDSAVGKPSKPKPIDETEATNTYAGPPRSGCNESMLTEASSWRDLHNNNNNNNTNNNGIWFIDVHDLELSKELGSGNFGVVFLGKWKKSKVAVKQIKLEALEHGGTKGQAAREEFEAELSLMVKMQPHSNVVQYRGITELENGDLAVVIEYCSKGSLVDALYGSKPRDLTESQLLKIAFGSACGLAHLHDQGIIHRDIAARNVLLHTNNLIPKLADFGMSREMLDENNEYYYQGTVANFGPIRWMAPEQLEKRQYVIRSDMYAFGVLLFEIFARSKPWPDKQNLGVVTAVSKGERMEPPRSAPKQVRQLMISCWAHKSRDRPTSRQVRDILGELVDDLSSESSS